MSRLNGFLDVDVDFLLQPAASSRIRTDSFDASSGILPRLLVRA